MKIGVGRYNVEKEFDNERGIKMLGAVSIRFVNLGFEIKNMGKSINVFGIDIAYYGIIIAMGMLIAMLLIYKEAKRTGQNVDNYYDLTIVTIICGIIGARLYYVIFEWDNYKNDLLAILNLRNGGLAIYGGILGGGLAAFIYSRIKKMSFPKILDTVILGVLIGQIMGRWGNFFNREAFGGYTNNLFAMQIKLDEVGGVISDSVANHIKVVNGIEYIQVHPTFLYESLWNLCLFIGIMLYRKHKKFEGELASIYMIGYGIGRFFIESLRTDQLVIKGIGIAISQVVSIILIIVGITIIIRNRCKLRRDMKQSIQEN